jgi:hypothetical protein
MTEHERVQSEAAMQIKLRPWAAYVIGRSPWRIGVYQEEMSANVVFLNRLAADEEWDRLVAEIASLDDAIAVLAQIHRLDDYALHQLHLVIRDLLIYCREQIDGFYSQDDDLESRLKKGPPP